MLTSTAWSLNSAAPLSPAFALKPLTFANSVLSVLLATFTADASNTYGGDTNIEPDHVARVDGWVKYSKNLWTAPGLAFLLTMIVSLPSVTSLPLPSPPSMAGKSITPGVNDGGVWRIVDSSQEP